MSEQLPASRKEAKAIGSKRYLGSPCPACGGTLRWTSDWNCVACKAARQAHWQKANPEKKRERQSRWEQQNLTGLRQRQREWRKERLTDPAYREKTNQQMRRWRKQNPDKTAAIRRRRSVRGNGPGISVSDIVRLAALQNGRCAECRVKLVNGAEIDHIIPLARGGDSATSNLQLLCPPCNREKNAKDPLQIARERGRLI